MKATCNHCKDNPNHRRKFCTIATVVEEWLVDENGNWVETVESLDTVNGPHSENVWTCADCGNQAEVGPDDD